ncbi:MAG: flagellar motor switch protein FliN [Desulfobacterales bacterium]|jgi:flagellar motor switch protein FliN
MIDIDNFDIRAIIIDAVIDVFDTMVSMQVEFQESEPPDSTGTQRMVATVNFAGNVLGFVNIQVDSELSRMMTASMLDIDIDEVKDDGEIKDLLAEMSNVVCGNLKSALNAAGHHCDISTPSITYGTDFTIKSLNMENYERFAFRCGGNIIFVEMGVKLSELAQADSRQDKGVDVDVDDDAAQSEEPASAQESKEESEKTPEDVDLDLLLDIPLEIKVELGRARITIQKLLNLAPGSAVKLIKLEGEPVDILVNDTLIAKGEVLVQNEKYGIRVTEITSRMDRIRSFSI